MGAGHTELRQDPLTGNWVIIASGRGARPHDFTDQAWAGAPLSSGDCPFCRGHEHLTPPEVLRVGTADGDWLIRVVPNKYAVLAPGRSQTQQALASGFQAMPGHGYHEVIIETPEHDTDLPFLELDHVREVLRVYRARYQAIQERGARLIVIFRNHGPTAGTSLIHPHSQIIGAPLIPSKVRSHLEHAISHYEANGQSLYTDVLSGELDDGRRILLEDDRFVAFLPFASSWPFEVWIMPRSPRPSFGATSDEELDGFAFVLRTVLRGLYNGLEDPDYNYVIHSVPSAYMEQTHLSWYMQVVPRLTTPAGFELGSGIHVNSTDPEAAAAHLRRMISEQI